MGEKTGIIRNGRYPAPNYPKPADMLTLKRHKTFVALMGRFCAG